MTDDGPSTFLDERVESVSRFHVDQIRPCAKNLQRSQLASMLVRNDVVRVIGARAVIAETTNHPARNRTAGQHAIRTVRLSRSTSEQLFEIGAVELPDLAGRRLGCRVWTDCQRLRLQLREVIF